MPLTQPVAPSTPPLARPAHPGATLAASDGPGAPSAAALPGLTAMAGLVGRTPMLALELRVRGRRRRVHAKAEYLNLTGSIKDRMALHVLG